MSPGTPVRRKENNGAEASEPVLGGSIGERLRAAREARGVSISAASAHTKLRIAYLQALESNAFDQLPAPLYAKNFVRLYANYLGLNGAQLAAQFSERVGPVASLAGSNTHRPQDYLTEERSWGRLPAVVAVLGLAVLLVVAVMSRRAQPAGAVALDSRVSAEALDAHPPVNAPGEDLPPLN